MRTKTIEQWLTWAYYDQKVHLAREQGMPIELGRKVRPRLAVMEFGADAVDDSMHFDFEAHPDAYVIHKAVMALRPFEYVRSADEIEMLVARRALGEQVTKAGAAVDLSYRAHDEKGGASVERVEAMSIAMIRRAIVALPGPVLRPRDLVLQYAITSRRPDMVRDPLYVAERGSTYFSDAGRRWGWVMLRWVGDDPMHVLEQRRIYAAWWAALAMLRDGLMGRLVSFGVSPELPPAPYPIDCA